MHGALDIARLDLRGGAARKTIPFGGYLYATVTDRDDAAERRKYVPDYERKVPRW